MNDDSPLPTALHCLAIRFRNHEILVGVLGIFGPKYTRQERGNDLQRPFQIGSRFSAKALAPSSWSSEL